MEQGKVSKKFIIIYTVLCICIMVGIGVAWWIGENNLNSDYAENEVVINELQNRIAEMASTEMTTEEIIESATEAIKTGNELLDKAAESGQFVADYQNWNIETQRMEYTQELGDEMKARADEMDSYVDSNGRTSWYYYDDTRSDVQPFWTFCTTYEFSENTVPVLWVCYNQAKPDELLAYAEGVYHADDHIFYDVTYHTTSVGNKYPPGSEGYGAGGGDDETEVTDSESDTEATEETESME